MEIQKEDVKVLLVDDYASIRESLGRILGIMGYSQIEYAADGQQALDTASQYLPDLVIMDTSMPGPNGYDVCRQMRQAPYGSKIAIMGMSSVADFEVNAVTEAWLDAGADNFFDKMLVLSEEGKADLDARILAALEKYQQ